MTAIQKLEINAVGMSWQTDYYNDDLMIDRLFRNIWHFSLFKVLINSPSTSNQQKSATINRFVSHLDHQDTFIRPERKPSTAQHTNYVAERKSPPAWSQQSKLKLFLYEKNVLGLTFGFVHSFSWMVFSQFWILSISFSVYKIATDSSRDFCLIFINTIYRPNIVMRN